MSSSFQLYGLLGGTALVYPRPGSLEPVTRSALHKPLLELVIIYTGKETLFCCCCFTRYDQPLSLVLSVQRLYFFLFCIQHFIIDS